MRRFLALAAPWVLLAACTGGGATEPGSTSTPSATASARGSPSASASAVAPPVLPEVAKEHTEAGAVAFVQHFWDVVNYAQTSLDVMPLQTLYTRGCERCAAGAEGLLDVSRRGGIIAGGIHTLSEVRTTGFLAGDLRFSEVTFTLSITPQTVDYPGTARDIGNAGTTARGLFTLVANEDGWLVDGWEVIE